VLRDVSSIDTSTVLFGKKYPIPIGISPTAMQRLAGGNGELDVARAAGKFDTTMILSTLTTSAVEDVIRAAGKPVDFWFQLYITRDRETIVKVIQQVEGM
jgi:(S)-2-hydroxy-acid oxidase